MEEYIKQAWMHCWTQFHMSRDISEIVIVIIKQYHFEQTLLSKIEQVFFAP